MIGVSAIPPDPTFAELTRRFEAGAALVEQPSERASNDPGGAPTALSVITADRELKVVAAGDSLDPNSGDRMIWLVDRS